MKTSDAQLYAATFDAAKTLENWNGEEASLWFDLNVLTIQPVPSQATSDRLLSDIERLRGLNRLIATAAHQVIDTMKPLRLSLSQSDQEGIQRMSQKCSAVLAQS